MDAKEALDRLKSGNERFVQLSANESDVGLERRSTLANEGQHPFAVVVACSDSRVVPEHLFNCGLGDIFTIRTAGNTIGDHELASAVYACAHLGCKLLVVMGHTNCGAVGAALAGGEEGAVGVLTGAILDAIGDESDPMQACILNVEAGLAALAVNEEIAGLLADGLQLQGAVHHIDTGVVEFL